jgi:hypothetical protein
MWSKDRLYVSERKRRASKLGGISHSYIEKTSAAYAVRCRITCNLLYLLPLNTPFLLWV